MVNPVMNDSVSFINDSIFSNKILGVINSKKIFLEAIREYQNGNIDEKGLAGVAYNLLEVYNEMEDIFKADQELGGLLHDAEEFGDNEDKIEVLKNMFTGYLKASICSV